MATIYEFNVRCVSAFCAYDQETITQIVKDALKNWEDKETGLKLESITVEDKNK